MILVREGDETICTHPHHEVFSTTEARDILNSLLANHPHLNSIASAYRSLSQGMLSLSRNSDFLITRETKCVYVAQKEYATVDPSLVDVIGTDGQGGCVGVVMRNPKSGWISVAHVDFPKVVDKGLNRMLSSLLMDEESENEIVDVHIINGHNEAPREESETRTEGISYEICVKIIEFLCKSTKRFNMKTLHTLNRNTSYDKQGNSQPMFSGFLVETASGLIFPGWFDNATICPDSVVRKARLNTALFCPATWEDDRLLDTYDTRSDKFVITPCPWDMNFVKSREARQKLPDREIINNSFTTPVSEKDVSFYATLIRRECDFFIKHPDWKETFPAGQPRIFIRGIDGSWTRSYIEHPQISKRRTAS
ncbi:unnamed protein product [Cuscuta epithymum]|uniref:Protein N-terminal asparagine amidohydrolase n=1 Tax=Cuscuta epithymum TaxID=186058 RepID=A0AAV0CJD3_9ASTE|nr:unnamed protein product [Cuscuta epithymum]